MQQYSYMQNKRNQAIKANLMAILVLLTLIGIICILPVIIENI